MPVIVGKREGELNSISLLQPEKCATQNSRVLLLETDPYKDTFKYDDNTVSAWNSFIVLRNHFDRLLSVWYHSCVDPRNVSGVPKAIWETGPNDTFRKFVSRVCSGLYTRDLHVMPYTASHQEEFYNEPEFPHGKKFKHGVQVCNYIAPMEWSSRATYVRLEKMDVVFSTLNQWLGLPADANEEKWRTDLKGNHHIEYSDSNGGPDLTITELLEHKAKYGALPSASLMWDDDMYSTVETCEAYMKDHATFEPLGLLSRHGTEEYSRGGDNIIEYTNEQHVLWKRYAELYQLAGEQWVQALDEIWENFRKDPYFWPVGIVGQPKFFWDLVNTVEYKL